MLRAHRLVGWLTFAVFIATGFYLHFHAGELAGGVGGVTGDATAHATLRANHIYILMAALLNLAFAKANPLPSSSWRVPLRRLGRVLILVAPVILIAAFVREGARPTMHILERPLTVAGVFALVLGTLAALAGTRVGSQAK